MSRFAAGQIALAFVLTLVGTVKAIRIAFDQIDDATSHMTGLR